MDQYQIRLLQLHEAKANALSQVESIDQEISNIRAVIVALSNANTKNEESADSGSDS